MPSSDEHYPIEEKHPHNKLTSGQQTLAGGELFFRKTNSGEAEVVGGDDPIFGDFFRQKQSLSELISFRKNKKRIIAQAISRVIGEFRFFERQLIAASKMVLS